MLKSSNLKEATKSFTIKVEEKDGKFHASSPNAPKIPAQVGSTQKIAVSLMRQQLEKSDLGEVTGA